MYERSFSLFIFHHISQSTWWEVHSSFTFFLHCLLRFHQSILSCPYLWRYEWPQWNIDSVMGQTNGHQPLCCEHPSSYHCTYIFLLEHFIQYCVCHVKLPDTQRPVCVTSSVCALAPSMLRLFKWKILHVASRPPGTNWPIQQLDGDWLCSDFPLEDMCSWAIAVADVMGVWEELHHCGADTL